MKYLLLIFLTLLLSPEADAQDMSDIETLNRFLVGGSLGFNYWEYKSKGASEPGAKTFSLSASPFVGYSLTKNIMLGLAMELVFEDTKTKGYFEGYNKQTDYLFSPFGRYYFSSPLFVQGQFNWGSSNVKYESSFSGDYTERKYSITGFGIGLGYDISLTDAVQLEPLIRFASSSYKNSNVSDTYTESGFLFNLGLIYRF